VSARNVVSTEGASALVATTVVVVFEEATFAGMLEKPRTVVSFVVTFVAELAVDVKDMTTSVGDVVKDASVTFSF